MIQSTTKTPAGIPPLAGLCSWDAALRSELSVEASVAWMKRHHYILKRLYGIFVARITAEPLYELKTAFSYHGYLCSEHVTALRKRVSELREPPLGLDVVPDAGLAQVCDEVLAARTTSELLIGLYDVLIPELMASCESFQQTTNALADAPSVRLTRFLLLELHDLGAFGKEAISGLVDATAREQCRDWEQALRATLAAVGGISGRAVIEAGATLPERISSTVPYTYSSRPQRDARFRDGYNGGVNPEAFLYDERFSPRDKILMLFYKRLREIDVPEMMASILHETPGKPWKFYAEMCRQLWDEARHAMLGEVGFASLGIDWSQIPINFTWSLNLNTQLTPQERHAVLFFIEQGLMPRSGKRFEWEVGLASAHPIASVIQDYDWADEVLHAQIGREWYVKEFADLASALAYGDQCWSKVMSHWSSYRDQGLTQHRNWWPELYQQDCAQRGVSPDPAALAFRETYQDRRADLKQI